MCGARLKRTMFAGAAGLPAVSVRGSSSSSSFSVSASWFSGRTTSRAGCTRAHCHQTACLVRSQAGRAWADMAASGSSSGALWRGLVEGGQNTVPWEPPWQSRRG